jgi:hypothetical protein
MAAALLPTTVDRGRRSPQRRRSPRTPDAGHAHRLCAGSPGTGSAPIMAHQIDRSACLGRQTPGALRPTITAAIRATTTELPTTLCYRHRAGIHERIIRSACLPTPLMVRELGSRTRAPPDLVSRRTRGLTYLNAACECGSVVGWPCRLCRHLL